MGKRYTREEIDQIQALAANGHTDREIAERLGRTEDGVRNIRHRMKQKKETKESIKSLLQDERKLNTRASQLQREISSLEARRQNIHKVLATEEKALNQKLHSALRKLKDVKPELFQITAEDQMGRLLGELASAFLKWLTA